MSKRATCKNCKREEMSIIREGLCGICAEMAKKNPDPELRASALAEVRAKVERSDLKGPRYDGPRKKKAAKAPGDRVRDIAHPKKTSGGDPPPLPAGGYPPPLSKTRSEEFHESLKRTRQRAENILGKKSPGSVHPMATPEKELGPSGVRACRICGCTDDHACEGGCSWVVDPDFGDLCSRCASDLIRVADNTPTRVVPSQAKSMKSIVIQLSFSGADILMYRLFEIYCHHHQRRNPEGQILFMIKEAVRAATRHQTQEGI